MKRTVTALIARSVNSNLAKELAESGFTLSTLKQKKKGELLALGLTEESVDIILAESRPPIPSDTPRATLYKNRYSCCVCRDSEKPIILHHIAPWHISKNHSESNLAVLCLHHHDAAHSKSSLSVNLTEDKIKAAKLKWESEVEKIDSRQILSIASMDGYDRWDYINHTRLFEIARARQVDLSRNKYFNLARSLGFIDSSGQLLAPEAYGQDSASMFWRYAGPHNLQMYAYMAEVVNQTIDKLPILNLSDHMDASFIRMILEPNRLIAFQGHHSFKDIVKTKFYQGPGQIRRARRSANKVSFQYTFDAWECTASSSKVDHMFSGSSCMTIARVTSVEDVNGVVLVKCSAIVAGTGFESIRTRTYGNIPPGTYSNGPLMGRPAIAYHRDMYGDVDEPEDVDG
jgi:hypothetical protein|tara:strand:+ start:359 stop:1561 length:1203 start_codon:yes stop_codon:yes gene_type:complete